MAELRRGCYPCADERFVMSLPKLRVGVAGAGYFGRFHALKVAAGARTVLSGVHDAVPQRAAALAAEAGSIALGWDALLAASDAVVVASPAAAHHAAAAAALRAGRHVLVEKPIAASLAEADELIALARNHALVLQVGHLLRYSPERAAIVARMPLPAYIECTRIAPFKPRGTDVSVVLDLMVHDLDMVLSLVAAPVEAVDAIGASVASPHLDMANARLRFANGAVASLVASRVATRTERRMRLFGREGLLSLDFTERTLRHLPRPPAGTVPDLSGAAVAQATWPAVDLIEAEHAAFAAAILDGAAVLVDGPAGRRALEAALLVEHAIAESQARASAGGLL
jgi:predicted dehydrogenase